MTAPQLQLYWREWAKVRMELCKTLSPKEADAERHHLHVKALGEGNDKSAALLTNAEFDKVLSAFRAISQPGNVKTQIDLAEMGATRKRVYIEQLLAAIGEERSYAESIIFTMQRKRRLSSTGAGSMLTLDTLHVGDLDKVKIALKKVCQRRWPTKDHILGEIHTLRLDNDFPEAPTASAIKLALRIPTIPALEKLHYDALLKVLATLRDLATGKAAFPKSEDKAAVPF